MNKRLGPHELNRYDELVRNHRWSVPDRYNIAADVCDKLEAVQAVYQREGGFDPSRQLDFLSRHQVTNVFATPTAIRSMMSIPDAGTRYPQKFRIVCAAGEVLNPRPSAGSATSMGLRCSTSTV